MIRDLIIIGSGPAALTAGIYASRASLNPLLIEGHEPGGQLTLTTEVENFPGFADGVQGPDLMSAMRAQATRLGSEIISTRVTSVDFSKRPFTIICENGEKLQTQMVIIATGASARWLGLPDERGLVGRGVSTCATCDAFFYRNKIVHVVGGGDTAMEDAGVLARVASKVYLVHRRDSFRASKAMIQKTKENPKIEILYNAQVVKLDSDDSGLTGIVVRYNDGRDESRKTDGLFYALGHTPNTAFLNKQVAIDEHGFIETLQGHPDTTVPGVFAAGDVQDSYYRQAITSAGSGARAAIRAERFLEEHGRV